MPRSRTLDIAVILLACATLARAGPFWPGWFVHEDSDEGSAQNAITGTNGTIDLIVVFNNRSYVTKLNIMCHPSKLTFATLGRAFGLGSECHMPNLCTHIFSKTVHGFSGTVSKDDLARVQKCLPGAVYYEEENQVVHKAEDDGFWHPVEFPESTKTSGAQGPPVAFDMVTGAPTVSMFSDGTKTQPLDIDQLWNLDRIDQRGLPLNREYQFGTTSTRGTGNGTTVYVVDSGIIKDHQEFGTWDGGASRASYGWDFIDGDSDCMDCDGHGTHVAGTAVGLSVGVAKDANVVSVRILDCEGSGTISNTVAALDWVATNHRAPAVVTLSLGIQVGSWSRVLEDAVTSLVNDHGITVVVAAGNSAVDACYVAPANVGVALTVAASNVAARYNDSSTSQPDTLYQWTNTGPCVKLFAPGVDIYSACGGAARCSVVNNSSYTYASGTSMAVPHVAGVAATYLEVYPQAKPSEVMSAILNAADRGTINPSLLASSTPNIVLYSRVLDASSSVMAASGP